MKYFPTYLHIPSNIMSTHAQWKEWGRRKSVFHSDAHISSRDFFLFAGWPLNLWNRSFTPHKVMCKLITTLKTESTSIWSKENSLYYHELTFCIFLLDGHLVFFYGKLFQMVSKALRIQNSYSLQRIILKEWFCTIFFYNPTITGEVIINSISLITIGRVPYNNILDHTQLLNYIKSGRVMKRPKVCPKDL
jgi:hypothetical protein